MAGGVQYCEPCAMVGRKRLATTGYVSAFDRGAKTHCCETCWSDVRAFNEHMSGVTGPGGPYEGECGSKGGGASELMASYWNGKAGAIRKQVFNYLRSHPAAGAEDIARAIGEDPDNVSPRCSELTKAKFGALLVKGPRSALTERGNGAHVYQINDKALWAKEVA